MRFKTYREFAILAVALLPGCGAAEGTAGEDSSVEDGLGAVAEPLNPLAIRLSSPFKLKNFQDQSKCLGVSAGTPTVGQALIVWDCDNSANQTWVTATAFSDPQYLRFDNKVAVDRSLTTGTGNNGSTAMIWNSFVDYNPQGWKKLPMFNLGDGSPCYRLESKAGPGRVLGVLGGIVANGKPAGLWTDFGGTSHPDQIWCAVK